MGLLKVIGDHPEDLASGRVVAPEEPFEASALASKPTGDDATPEALRAYEHDRRLLDEGRVIEAKMTPVALEGEALQARARELGIEGRTTMTAAKLKRAVAQAEQDPTAPTDGGDSA
jgi:hypothetical protein